MNGDVSFVSRREYQPVIRIVVEGQVSFEFACISSGAPQHTAGPGSNFKVGIPCKLSEELVSYSFASSKGQCVV